MSSAAQQEYDQLLKDIRALKRNRAHVPVAVYQKAAEDAQTHINAAIEKYTVTGYVPPPVVPPEVIPPVVPPTVPPPSIPTLQAGGKVTAKLLPETVALLATCFNSNSGSANWPTCHLFDVNGDGKIDVRDTSVITKGEQCVVLSVIESPQDVASPVYYQCYRLRDGSYRDIRIPDIVSIP